MKSDAPMCNMWTYCFETVLGQHTAKGFLSTGYQLTKLELYKPQPAFETVFG